MVQNKQFSKYINRIFLK